VHGNGRVVNIMVVALLAPFQKLGSQRRARAHCEVWLYASFPNSEFTIPKDSVFWERSEGGRMSIASRQDFTSLLLDSAFQTFVVFISLSVSVSSM